MIRKFYKNSKYFKINWKNKIYNFPLAKLSNFSKNPLKQQISSQIPKMPENFTEENFNEISKVFLKNVSDKSNDLIISYLNLLLYFRNPESKIFSKIENQLASRIHSMSKIEIFKIIKILSYHSNYSSFLIKNLERKIIIILNTLNCEENVKLLFYCTELSDNLSSKLINSIGINFYNKIKEYSIIDSFKISILLIQTKKIQTEIIENILNIIFEKNFIREIENLKFNEFSFAFKLFFTKFLENHNVFYQKKSMVNQSINTAINLSELNKISNFNFRNFSQDYYKNEVILDNKLIKIISNINIEEISSNNICIFLNGFHYLKKDLLNGLEEIFYQFLKKNIEILKVNEIINIFESAIIFDRLKDFMTSYFFEFITNSIKNFDIDQIIKIWIIISKYGLGNILILFSA